MLRVARLHKKICFSLIRVRTPLVSQKHRFYTKPLHEQAKQNIEVPDITDSVHQIILNKTKDKNTLQAVLLKCMRTSQADTTQLVEYLLDNNVMLFYMLTKIDIRGRIDDLLYRSTSFSFNKKF
jgi:hypothetical protein